MRILIVISYCILFSNFLFGQVTGGQNSFSYLQASNSAKIAGVGGDNVSSFGDDISMLYQNPALFHKEMENKASLNFTSYKSGAKLSSAQYVFRNSKIGAFSAGLTYLNYGVLTKRNEGGTNLGEFFANDFVIHGTKAFSQDNFKIGFTPKIAVSQIEKSSAIAMVTDIGGTFNHPNESFVIGMTIENVGFVAKNYTSSKSNLPFNVNAGFTVKPQHMPLKISVTAHHLQQFDILYDDPALRNSSSFVTDSVEYKAPLGGKILRHFTIGGEFVLSPNFNLRMGYNFQRRRELRLEDKSGGAGFSFGFMVKTKKYKIDFAKVYNNYAGRPVYLTLQIDFDNIIKKKQITSEEGII